MTKPLFHSKNKNRQRARRRNKLKQKRSYASYPLSLSSYNKEQMWYKRELEIYLQATTVIWSQVTSRSWETGVPDEERTIVRVINTAALRKMMKSMGKGRKDIVKCKLWITLPSHSFYCTLASGNKSTWLAKVNFHSLHQAVLVIRT